MYRMTCTNQEVYVCDQVAQKTQNGALPTLREQEAARNKCIASSNKCLTTSNKKLLGTRSC